MIRVLIADDQEAARDGLRLLLSGEPDIDVIGAAVDGVELVALARRRTPDVVLTDIRMPGMDGIGAIKRLVTVRPEPAVVAVTTFDVDEYFFGALQSGAVGFVLKDSAPELFLDAVRLAYRGQGLIDPQVTRRLVSRFARTSPRPAPPELDALTPRETEVLRGLARSLSNAEVADELGIAAGTVKVHVERILAKLGVATRVQAVIHAHKYGLVTWTD
ncbi:response regulator [Kibdelosporangium phytohabitans]|uniref:Transcriptional regulator n=1 Tax=Kibdelosporangium phytohabitans TaxID=860235 RepID=A0A0N9HVY0_9PSEU|nr:response regulator transcription factor [Kibdelosporangium phytohabitans]ALG09336.1 transcriptional regulator [Kibdelosporangium phytohabitans]MBE1469401.1 DNA-binding NarL/FixJ family response regulator [Kibdelosporangium phytohabitans]